MLIQPEQKAHLWSLINTENLPNMELAGLLLKSLGATWADIGIDDDYLLNLLGEGSKKNMIWVNKIAKAAHINLNELFEKVGLADFDFVKVSDFVGKNSVAINDKNADKVACLKYLKNIKNIYSYTTENIFLDSLPYFPSVQQFRLGNLSFKNAEHQLSLTFLEKFPQLISLELNAGAGNKSSIQDLKPISQLVFLEWLEIKKYKIGNLKPLANLSKLRFLVLEKTGLSNLIGLRGAIFPTLVGCQLTHNKLPNLADFPTAPCLNDLDVSNNQLFSLDELPELPSLQKLNLEKNNLQQAQRLEHFELLSEVNISNNLLQAASGLAHIPTLKLANNQLQDLSPFTSPKNKIDYLDLRQNPFQKGISFRYFPRLGRFFADTLQGWGDEEIEEDFLPLYEIFFKKSGLFVPRFHRKNPSKFYQQPFTYLLKDKTQFQCHKKQLASLSFLKYFDYLETLGCGNNRLTSLKDLNRLKQKNKLWSLDCSRNQLQDIAILEKFKGLRWLDCSENPIEKLSQIADFEQLKHLDCSDTKIKDLSPLQSAKHLEYLDISRSQVSNLEHLRNCQKLKSLNCRGLVLESLEPLYELPLQRLALSSKQLLPVVLAEFRQKNPTCKIKFG
jgi:Leucine Rich repeats (2 copies)